MKLSKLQIAGLQALQQQARLAQQALNEAMVEAGMEQNKSYRVQPDGTIEEEPPQKTTLIQET